MTVTDDTPDPGMERLRAMILASGLFDAEWYARRYADVDDSGLDPLDDFLRFGLALARDPGPAFSTHDYVHTMPEALADPDGPLIHCIRAGHIGQAKPLQDSAEAAPAPGNSGPHQTWLDRQTGTVEIGLTTCQIKDFRLTVGGWVRDPGRPGAVNRLRIRVGDIASDPVVARPLPSDADPAEAPALSSNFVATLVMPEHLIGQDITLEVIDTDTLCRLTPEINPSPPVIKPAVQAILPTDLIIGRVLKATPTYLNGWAFVHATKSAEGIELVLKINDKPYAVTRCVHYREDIKTARGGDGYCGFQFTFPDNLWRGEPFTYEVVSTQGQARLTCGTGVILPEGRRWVPATSPAALPHFESSADLAPEVAISVVILNRNGRDILRDMLHSAEATGDLGRAEWIIIDHQSTDGSDDVCRSFAARGFDVRMVSRNGNYSFSESNNFAVDLARGKTLVFANNDLIFIEPVLDRVIAGLRDSRIGVLGAELLDNIAAPEWIAADGRSAVQHHGIHFAPRLSTGMIRPFEARADAELPVAAGQYSARPGVTAAFIAMRRDDFGAIGGFDTEYSYGYEDVDLSLKVMRDLNRAAMIDKGMRIIHRHGFSRKKYVQAGPRRSSNSRALNQTWGTWLRRQIREDLLSRPAFWTGRLPVVGFTVMSETSGDYFTALELGKALQQQMALHLVFIPFDRWNDISDVDILINMSPRFDLHSVRYFNPFAIRINWIRQFFDTWAEDASLFSYDHLVCSSSAGADFIGQRTGATVHVMPIASDTRSFAAGQRRDEFTCDYCFTGSHFNVRREIEFNLDPSAITGTGAVFGNGWETTSLAPITRGPLPYDAMPDVYASTRIVIDDGVFATAPWGSVNSRVFDALAAGCLVVTDNRLGAQELFGDLLPTYRDRTSLTETLNWWLANEDARQDRVRLLQQIVRDRHDYAHRASQILDIVSARPPLRIAVKCPATRASKELWGDYHYALSLAKALRELGAVVRVDVREDTDIPLTGADDVVIVLHGTTTYVPMPNQINILWVISNPTGLSHRALETYDHVCFASDLYRARIAPELDVPVSTMLQCTDTDLFSLDPALLGTRPDRALFVGNSRGVFRPVVRWAIEQGLDLDLYGSGWQGFIDDSRLKGGSVPNQVLGGLYCSSRVVLNDHWKAMAQHGFLSNRAFDVLASGGFLITDHVAGIEQILPKGTYAIYGNATELAEQIRMNRPVDLEQRQATADWVKTHHSFRTRARAFLDIITAHPKLRGHKRSAP